MYVHLLILVDMATNNAMIGELHTNQKSDDSKYDMWKRKIRYLLNERDLLEHSTVAKFHHRTRTRMASPLILSLCSIKKACRPTRTSSRRIGGHDLLCYTACTMT